MLETVWQDVRHGIRLWRRSLPLAATAVFSLALGIGVTVSMFLIVNAALLRPVPVPAPEELVLLFTGTREEPYGALSYPDYLDYRDSRTVFRGLAAYGEVAVSLSHEESPGEERGVIATGNFFEVLGLGALHGRLLTPEDDHVPGEHPVVVLSHGLWQRRFGGDPATVGRKIQINGSPYVVVGVAPAGFRGPDVLESYDLYVPMAMQAQVRPPRAGFSGEMDPDLLNRRNASWLRIIGRLGPSIGIEKAEASLESVSKRLADEHPDTNRGEAATLYPLRRIDPRGYPVLRSIAALLMAVSSLVLVVATANVMNLLLVRAVSRRREIAVRLSLGGSRGRLVRQLLTESLLLGALGGPLGLLLASWTVSGLTSLVPSTGIFSFNLDFDIDGRVAFFTLVVSILSVVLVGLAPAVQSSRHDLVQSLRDLAGAGRQGRMRFRGRNALVLAQIALSIVLLVGAGLFLRSFWNSSSVSPGFDADEVLTASIRIDLLHYTKSRGRQFYRDLLDRMKTLPGVRAASLARTVPLAGAGRRTELILEGSQAPSTPEEELLVGTNVVGLDYFRTMGIAFARGRDFTSEDVEGSLPVVIANQSFVTRFFPSGDPLGKRLRLDRDETEWREIVGIVQDSKYRTLGEEPTPHLYQPLAQQHETGVTLLLRTEAPERIAGDVRRVLLAMDPYLPVSDIQPLTALLESSLFPARMAARLLVACALLAAVLASLGLYGLMSFAVSRRTRELGIRVALGARPEELAKIVVGEGLLLVGAGVLIGSLSALAVTRLLSSFLFGVSAADPGTFLTAGLVLTLVMLGSTYVPARRAASADPRAALRYE